MSEAGLAAMDWGRLGEGSFWLALTIAFYVAARRLQQALGGTPLANTVLVAAIPLMAILYWFGIPVSEYQRGGWLLLWVLGPATVALAVPLYLNFAHVRVALWPMCAALLVGPAVAVVSGLILAEAMGARIETIRSLAPKTVTTPIAMGIAREIGGIPELTAAFVIFTGIIGAVFGAALFNAIGMRDARTRGFAMGVISGGIGTARAFQESFLAGTFSGVGMTLSGILTAIVLPLVWLAFF
nr:LrgB family protein [Aerococcus urinae]